MKCVLSPRALRQLNEIHDHIAKHDPLAAQAVVERVGEIMEVLEEQPGIGRATKRGGVFGFPLVRYPYLVFYRVNARRNEVKILRVFHAARRHPGFQEPAGEFLAR